MKLLMMSGYLPHPSWGAGARSYHLLRSLAQQHTVSLIALTDVADTDVASKVALLEQYVHDIHVVEHPFSQGKRWRQLLSAVRGQSHLLRRFTSQSMQHLLHNMLTSNQYDVVLVESVFLAGYSLPVNIPVVIDQHNIEHEILWRTYVHERSWLRKWYSWREYGPLKRGEIERCGRADVVVVTSERERDLLTSLLPGKSIKVVPNGVDTQTFCVSETPEVPHQIIFTGTMDYYPNIDAVLSFAYLCWPRIRTEVPDATWLIVGRNPSPDVRRLKMLPGVTVVGSVPDIRPYLASSAVALAPLHVGSGTRLKILEALAMGKAVVSTSPGYEGLALVPDQHLLVVDQHNAFAESVIELLHNPERRAELGKAGRALVETQYSWEQCGECLLQALPLNNKESNFIC